MAKLAPSILAADFSNLQSDLSQCESLNVDWLHLDIMDGHFVPNISFGPPVVDSINKTTDKFLDVHLMLSEPEKYFEPFQKSGADAITFHIEIHKNPIKYALELRDMGLKSGISLNPSTDINKVLNYLAEFDILLIMSVNPGLGGQKFIESTLDKIKTAKKYIKENNLDTEISIDGGVDTTNAKKIVEAGADILVMGTAFFEAQSREEVTKLVQSL